MGEDAFQTQECLFYIPVPHGPDTWKSPALLYTDDILISSQDIQSHLQHVCQVLERLCLHCLCINPDKCVFAAPSLEHLGMRVSAEGCVPLSKHTDVISTFPQPSDKKGLQCCLGIINFNRHFIREAAGLFFSLTEALKGKGSSLTWSQSMLGSFSTAKSVLAYVPILVHPDPTSKISVSVDALGAVLQQEVAGSWAPLSFYSRKLSSARSRCSAFDRVLLAAHSTHHHIRILIEVNEFVLFSDHKPLTHALFRTSLPLSFMQQGCLSYISEFHCRITHLTGAKNVVAYVLSHPDPPPIPKSPHPFDVLMSKVSEVFEVSEVLEVLEVWEVTEQMVSSLPSPSPTVSPPRPPLSVPGDVNPSTVLSKGSSSLPFLCPDCNFLIN